MTSVIKMAIDEPKLNITGDNIFKDFEEIELFYFERMAELTDRIAATEAALDRLQEQKESYEKVNFRDAKFKGLLARSSRTWTMAQIYQCWLEYTLPERQKEARQNAIWEATRNRSADIKHFVLINSKRNKIHLLAPSAEVARYIAWQNDRITSPQNGKFLKPVVTAKISAAIERAIADGWPGEFEIIGEHILHKRENKIY